MYDGELVRGVRGHKGILLENAHSAFHPELVAADAALQEAAQVGQRCLTT